MKRRNVQEAFVGEPDENSLSGHLDNMESGDDAVDIEVRGGKIQVVVPSGTPDERLFEDHSFLGGELELEDGRVLSFQIQDGAIGAHVIALSHQEDDRGAGLSSIPNIPAGT